MPEIIDPVFTKTSPKRSFCMTENERFGLVFTKTGSINSGTGRYHFWNSGFYHFECRRCDFSWCYVIISPLFSFFETVTHLDGKDLIFPNLFNSPFPSSDNWCRFWKSSLILGEQGAAVRGGCARRGIREQPAGSQPGHWEHRAHIHHWLVRHHPLTRSESRVRRNIIYLSSLVNIKFLSKLWVWGGEERGGSGSSKVRFTCSVGILFSIHREKSPLLVIRYTSISFFLYSFAINCVS